MGALKEIFFARLSIHAIDRIISFVFLLFVSTSISDAQTLFGKVVDERGLPVQYATVVLHQLKDSAYVNGGITDNNGKYLINLSDPEMLKSCFLTFSCIGYERLEVRQIPSPELNVQLREAVNELAEVVVRSHMKAIEIQPDGQKIDIKKLGLSNLGNVFELLGMVPGVSVRDENINVVGRGVPLIYVNGHQLRNLSLLSQYDTKDIISVKVINNPGVRYESSANSVIEIKTRNPEDGLGGSVLLRGEMGKEIGTRQYASLIYKKSAIDWFVTFSNNNSKNRPFNSINMNLPNPMQSKLSTDVAQKKFKNHRFLVAGFNYTINEKANMGVQYDFTQTPKWQIESLIHTSIEQAGAINHEEQKSNYRDEDHHHNINGYFLGNISSIYTLRYDMNFFAKKEKAINDFTITKDDITKLHQTDLRQNSWLISGRLQNFISTKKGQLTIGAEGAYTKNKQRHVATLNSLNQTDSRIENQLYGAFVSYSNSFGHLKGEIGVRYEYNKYIYYEREQVITDQSKQYHYFTPSLQIIYRGPVSVNFSFRTMTDRPSYHLLSDRHQYNNEYLYESGNKYLLPKRTEIFSLGAQWKSLSIGAEYIHVKDDILFNTKYNTDLLVALSKPYNVPNTYAVNLQGQWSPIIGIWRPYLQVTLHKPFVEFEEKKYNDLSATIIIRSLFDFKKKGFNFSLNGTLFSGGSQQLNDIASFFQIDFLANKTCFKGKLRLSLGIEDIFSSYNPTAYLGTNGLDIRMKQKPDIRKVSFTIRYFLPTKKNRFDGKASSSEINRL